MSHTNPLTVTIPQALRDIAANLASQNGRMTNNPIFLVQKKERQIGIDLSYSDNDIWMGEDGEEVTDQDEIDRLDNLDHLAFPSKEETLELVRNTKTGYIDRWETVQPFFTEVAAQQFIDSIAHRHDDGCLRIYVDSAYQNDEWQAIRNFLLSLNPPKASSVPAAPTP